MSTRGSPVSTSPGLGLQACAVIPDILLFFCRYINLFLYFFNLLFESFTYLSAVLFCLLVCFGLKKIYLVDMDECLPAYMSLYHRCAWCSGRSEEGIRSPETGYPDAFEPPCGCWEPSLGPL